MKVLILTLGTRGDVQPFVALGTALRTAGHAVTLCTSSNFESFVAGHGLEYGYMNDDIMRLIESDEAREMMERASNIWQWAKLARRMARQMGPMHRRMLEDTWATTRKANPDLIVYHPKAFGAPHFAEALKVPCILALPMPLLVPTRDFPAVGFPPWKLGAGGYNRLTYRLVRVIMPRTFGTYVREWREANRLPPQPRPHDMLHTTSGEAIPVLHAYSRHVVPQPTDWPSTATVTGYWFLEAADTWQPSPELSAFLDGGASPVYVGFGSMAGRDPARLTAIVVEALRRANVRGILATGWGGLSPADLPDSIFKLDHAPHDWLFPRVAAVVHHGGAGTTPAGLRAGRSTLVCPFIADQPFWGRRVHALGVGPRPIPQKKLTVENLAAAIGEIATDAAMRANAAALAGKIASEDGLGAAVAAIEAHARRHGPPRP